MTSGIFDHAPVSMMTGLCKVMANATTTYCVLGTVQPVKNTWATYNDIKWAASSPFECAVVAGSPGYTLGGRGVATAVPDCGVTAVTGLKTTTPFTNVFSVTGVLACHYAIIQNALTASAPTTTTNALLCYLDIGAQQVTNGTLTLAWNQANGIYTVTSSAAI